MTDKYEDDFIKFCEKVLNRPSVEWQKKLMITVLNNTNISQLKPVNYKNPELIVLRSIAITYKLMVLFNDE